MARPGLFLLVVLLVSAAGCHLLSSLSDVKFSEPRAGAGGSAGAGGGAAGDAGECEDASDCPGIDASCRYRACEHGACGFDDAVAGTPCTELGGKLCDGRGTCVACAVNEDCAAADVCVEGACVPAHCIDGEKSGDESDSDCGGSCPGCNNGADCSVAADCKSSFCKVGSCAPCTGDSDCAGAPGTYCASGACLPVKADGDVCGSDLECQSGHCPNDDGVCCAESCAETCEACREGKTGEPNGTCALVDTESDPDPDGECADEGPASCGALGQGCRPDAASCVLYAAGAQCAAPSCENGQQTSTGTCNGLGSCIAGVSTECGAYACGATACLSNCTNDGHCAPGHYCAATNKCEPKVALGADCGAANQCESSFCVDGVCCDSACNGECVGCTAALTNATDGTCSFIPAATDPENECGATSDCNGAGVCKLLTAQPCAAGAECLTGNCPAQDGVCCNAPCDGECVACAMAKTGATTGTCASITFWSNPDLECGDPMRCSGDGACVSCGYEPVPPGGVCPAECTGGCPDGKTCIFDCGSASCANANLVCPADFACLVQCPSTGSCDSAIISCPGTYACDLSCDAADACKNAAVTCSATGACSIACTADNACAGADVTCGANACAASCAGGNVPNMDCAASCGCTSC